MVTSSLIEKTPLQLRGRSITTVLPGISTFHFTQSLHWASQTELIRQRIIHSCFWGLSQELGSPRSFQMWFQRTNIQQPTFVQKVVNGGLEVVTRQ